MSFLSDSDGTEFSFGFRRRLVFLGDKDLEAGSTLRRRIHRLVGKDDRRTRRDNFFRFRQELGWLPAFLRRREEALARLVLPRGCHFHPAQMSLLIHPVEGA